mmetsp:Transcript_25956/g.74465  ORF Transcript_25956/g.74465 Transcript_25956/m.74465 type:complete len:235 (-) Transcript_25956:102-806(-)
MRERHTHSREQHGHEDRHRRARKEEMPHRQPCLAVVVQRHQGVHVREGGHRQRAGSGAGQRANKHRQVCAACRGAQLDDQRHEDESRDRVRNEGRHAHEDQHELRHEQPWAAGQSPPRNVGKDGEEAALRDSEAQGVAATDEEKEVPAVGVEGLAGDDTRAEHQRHEEHRHGGRATKQHGCRLASKDAKRGARGGEGCRLPARELLALEDHRGDPKLLPLAHGRPLRIQLCLSL